MILAKNYSPLDVNTFIKEIGNILSKGYFLRRVLYAVYRYSSDLGIRSIMRLLFQTHSRPGLVLISVCGILCRHVREPLAAYIVPSCDAHNSEYIARKL